MGRLDELTRKDMFSAVDKNTKDKAKKISGSKYIGITEDFVVHFSVRSVTANPPTTYNVKVKLVEYADIDGEEDLSVGDKVRLALSGDLAISCSCPAFRYWGYEYIVSQLEAIVGKEQTIFPKVRNPKLEGVMCKHCYHALSYLGMQWSRIAKDIKEKNFIKR